LHKKTDTDNVKYNLKNKYLIMKTWNLYLSGEIHSNWREEIKKGIEKENLPVSVSAPVTDHAASDDVGTDILGDEKDNFWKDHKGAKINAIRTRTLIEKADIVVVKFGEKYRQWNAAFDAGYAAALGKKLIVMHPEEHTHALKEVDGAAMAVTRTPDQVVDILKYVLVKD
jgi:YtoQ family protein